MKRLCALLCLLAACGRDGGSDGPPAPPPVGEASTIDVFDPEVVAIYAIAMPQSQWDAIVADPFNDTYRNVTVTWQGEVYPNVGLRPYGGRTRVPGWPKPSIRLNFDEFVPQREFHGYENIRLDGMPFDPSMMRERLSYAVYAARGVPVPKMCHARVVVNGNYVGLYSVEEHVNKEFVTKRWGANYNQLHDWTRNYEDVYWMGTNASTYVPGMWSAEIESRPSDAAAVRDLVNALNNASPAAIGGVFDVMSFINFIAVETLVGEGDAYIAGTDPDNDVSAGNFKLYRPPGGLYTLIAADRDQSFWRDEPNIFWGFQSHILTRRLIMEVPANQQVYRQVMLDLIDNDASADAMEERLDFIFAQVEQAGLDDPNKGITDSAWLNNVEDLREYFAERNADIRPQVE